ALLVAVQRGRVDVAVTGLERPFDGLLRLRAGVHLPHPQSEDRHPDPTGQLASRLLVPHDTSKPRFEARCGMSATTLGSITTLIEQQGMWALVLLFSLVALESFG